MTPENCLNRKQTISFLQEVSKLLEKDFSLGVFRISGSTDPGEDHFGVDPANIVDIGGVLGARIFDAGMRIVPTSDIQRENLLQAAYKRGHTAGKVN